MPPKTLFYLLFSIFILLISCKSQTFFSFEFIRLTFLACSRLPWLKTKIWLVFPPRVFPFPPLHHVWRPPNDTKNTTFIQIIIRKERKRRMVTTTKKLFLLIHWCLAQDSLYSLKDHLIFAANVLQRKWWVKVHTPKYPEWITNRLAWKSALFWVGEKKWQGTLSPMNSFKGGMRLAAHRVTEYEAGRGKRDPIPLPKSQGGPSAGPRQRFHWQTMRHLPVPQNTSLQPLDQAGTQPGSLH